MKRLDRRLWVALVMDLTYAAAGVLAILFPSKAVADTVPTWGIAVFGTFYIAGGLLCAIGVLSSKAGFRFVGLPLMIGSSAMYGGAVIIQYFRLHDGAFLFVGTLLLATAMGLADRWLVVSRRFHVVREGSRR